MLTGESLPVSKEANKAFDPKAPLGDRKNMCYSATSVVTGQAEGIVVGTGDSAEIGQISKMVNTVGGAGACFREGGVACACLVCAACTLAACVYMCPPKTPPPPPQINTRSRP
jgi:magnesium-transporting ATPase (P-type)